MEPLVLKLQQDFPALSFAAGPALCWSPEEKRIFYSKRDGAAGLLHELGHARLGHTHYSSDLELLKKEVEAWEEAFKLAREYHLSIDREHAEDCLDTYREWVHKRSLCPTCAAGGIQEAPEKYRCLNCQATWKVSAARFCRPYRRSK